LREVPGRALQHPDPIDRSIDRSIAGSAVPVPVQYGTIAEHGEGSGPKKGGRNKQTNKQTNKQINDAFRCIDRTIGGEKGRRESIEQESLLLRERDRERQHRTHTRKSTNQSIHPVGLGSVRFGSVRFVMTCHPGSRMRVCGCRVFRVIWGRSLPRSDGRDHHQELVDVFWDDNHCTPWVPVRVCEELNNLLFLNLLCNTVLHKARRDDDNE